MIFQHIKHLIYDTRRSSALYKGLLDYLPSMEICLIDIIYDYCILFEHYGIYTFNNELSLYYNQVFDHKAFNQEIHIADLPIYRAERVKFLGQHGDCIYISCFAFGSFYCNSYFSCYLLKYNLKTQTLQQLKSQDQISHVGAYIKDNDKTYIRYCSYDSVCIKPKNKKRITKLTNGRFFPSTTVASNNKGIYMFNSLKLNRNKISKFFDYKTQTFTQLGCIPFANDALVINDETILLINDCREFYKPTIETYFTTPDSKDSCCVYEYNTTTNKCQELSWRFPKFPDAYINRRIIYRDYNKTIYVIYSDGTQGNYELQPIMYYLTWPFENQQWIGPIDFNYVADKIA